MHHDHDHKDGEGCCHKPASCGSGGGENKNGGDCGGNRNCLLMAVALLAGLALVGGWAMLMMPSHGAGGGHGWKDPKQIVWPFDGALGTVDRQSAQRGFQVYKEVCAACHGLERIAFRNLEDIGFTEAEVKKLASDYSYKDFNDAGEEMERPGKPSDRFPSPYANEDAGRAANNGAYPPDLSLIVKARVDGPNYLYSLLTGYGKEAPAGVTISEGTHYNPYFSLTQGIAMPQPLTADQVTYEDGTAATLDQAARDLVVFLQWAAEPEMEERKAMGLKVMIFLTLGVMAFWIAKRRTWGNLH